MAESPDGYLLYNDGLILIYLFSATNDKKREVCERFVINWRTLVGESVIQNAFWILPEYKGLSRKSNR